MKPMVIRMLGDFSLEAQGVCVSEQGSRSRKVWGLLAYLICNRQSVTSQKKLIDLLYGPDSDNANPENALRITLYRIRGVLDQLWPGAGKELILYRDGGYRWNPEAAVELDCDRFEELSGPAGKELPQLMEALSLYRGEFLPRHNDENWAIPLTAHFHNRFVDISLQAAELLLQQQQWSQAAAVCRKAIQAEPYHEPLHQCLLKALGEQGDARGATNVYDTLRKRLFDDFGIYPNSKTQQVYRAAAQNLGERMLPMDEVLSQLQEPEGKEGALICDYEHFKILCYTECRAMERSGHVAHVALLGVTSSTGEPMNKRQQDKILEQLGEHIRLNLRRGDTVSRCSGAQYIVLLPRANYENSSMVCRRVIAAFHRAHPRTAVKIHYLVQPLSPGIVVP